MGTAYVVDQNGNSHELAFKSGGTLMELLHEHDMVRAECGGMKICATCHVFVDSEWYQTIGAADENECEMLDGTGDYKAGRSRLSCQIELSDELDGIKFELAPEL